MTKSTKSDSRFEVSNRRSDRREFLERSMLATAAALAAQSQWGASASAQDSKGPISPNEQIHVAVIGPTAAANRTSTASQAKREQS